MNEMLDQPPFTNQLYHDETVKEIRTRIEQLSACLDPSRQEALSTCYKQAIEQNPEDWQLHWRYSIYLRKGINDSRAEENQLRKAMELCPNNPSLYMALGRNLHRQGRYKEAQEILHHLLEMKPTAAEACVELAKIYRDRGDNGQFIEYLRKSIDIAPAVSADPYQVLAEAYYNEGETDKAIHTLRDAAAVFPEEETAQVHLYLGFLENVQGRYGKALAEMELALKINPSFEEDEMFRKNFSKLKAKAGDKSAK